MSQYLKPTPLKNPVLTAGAQKNLSNAGMAIGSLQGLGKTGQQILPKALEELRRLRLEQKNG